MKEEGIKHSQLTAKQTRFVQEYLVDSNATQAAIRAGYSKKTANKQGSQLLGKTSIKKAIDEKLEVISRNKEVSAENVIDELKSVALLDLPDFFSCDIRDLTDQDVERISKLSGVISTKVKAKIKALEMLAKYTKIYNESQTTTKSYEAIDAEILIALEQYQ